MCGFCPGTAHTDIHPLWSSAAKASAVNPPPPPPPLLLSARRTERVGTAVLGMFKGAKKFEKVAFEPNRNITSLI